MPLQGAHKPYTIPRPGQTVSSAVEHVHSTKLLLHSARLVRPEPCAHFPVELAVLSPGAANARYVGPGSSRSCSDTGARPRHYWLAGTSPWHGRTKLSRRPVPPSSKARDLSSTATMLLTAQRTRYALHSTSSFVPGSHFLKTGRSLLVLLPNAS